MSSAVGTCRDAPRNRGVNTGKVRLPSVAGQGRLTITLYGIMGDPAEHGESRLVAQAEPLRHPWEEVSQAEMTALDPLRYTGTSRGERERGRGVWTEDDASRRAGELLVRLEDVLIARSRACDA